MHNQAAAVLHGQKSYSCNAWEESAAGIDERDDCKPDLAKWQGFGWSMMLAAIAYGLFILCWAT